MSVIYENSINDAQIHHMQNEHISSTSILNVFENRTNRNLSHYTRLKESFGDSALAKNRIYLFPAPSVIQGTLLEYFMSGNGIHMLQLPLDDEESLDIGRSFTNRGQCASVVYVTGTLIKFLLRLREQGFSDEEIEQGYGFITIQPSTCTCRRGAFEEEFRRAVHSIGLKNFVLEFVDLGLPMKSVSGLEFNTRFYRTLFLSVMIADILNDMQRRIRPYEIEKGATDRIFKKVIKLIGESYQNANEKSLCASLKEAKKLIQSIPVDLSQLKPKVRIIGEYQVASTEGHCTGDMFRWLESQGAEVAVAQVSIFMLHKIWYRTWRNDQEFRAKMNHTISEWSRYVRVAVLSRIAFTSMYRLHRKYSKMLGNCAYPIPAMKKMMKQSQDLIDKSYYVDTGFTEIALHVSAFREKEADMVLSLKAFSCMPSLSCDAIQAKVERIEADAVFVALEMNGDAVANSRSRIQMKLSEAKKNIERHFLDLSKQAKVPPEVLLDKIRQLNLGVPALDIRKQSFGCTTISLIKENLL